jgi:DNA-binding response OmpR family regulator
MATTEKAMSEARTGATASRYRWVLLVEDEAPLRAILHQNLARRGIDVTDAGSVAEALAAIRLMPPDLILLDINLPDRSGWDVLRELRATGKVPPTVVVSAVQVPPAKLREFGIAAFLPKPFPIDALVRLVTGELDR